MKIVFVLSTFFPDHHAGTEIYVLNLARHLRNNGYEVSIIISKIDTKISFYEFDGFKVFCFPIKEKPSKKEFAGSVPPSGINEFLSILKQIKPDVVHFHSFNRAINSWHLKTAKESGFKTVFTTHLSGLFCYKGNLLYKEVTNCDARIDKLKCMECIINQKGIFAPFDYLFSYVINKCILTTPLKKLFPASLSVISNKLDEMAKIRAYTDRTIAISDWIKTAYKINGIDNVILVKQGIDTLRFNFKAKEQKKKKITLTFVGRLYPAKGLHVLLDALILLNNLNIYLDLIVIKTDNQYFEKIQQRIKSLKNVRWFENQKVDELSVLLNETDVVCVPSITSEAAPLIILEAFAKGIPVIGSDIGGIKDMVTHEADGLLFKVGDPYDLAKQIERLLLEPDLLLKLRNNIKPPRSISDVGKQMVEIYNNLIFES